MNNKLKFDYKWLIVALCFLMVFVTLGFCSSPRSQYIKPITEALGIDRATYSITDSCRYVATAVVNIFFGFLVAKLGPKKLIILGFISLATSSFLYAVSDNVWLMYLASILLGVGLSWTTTTMVGYVVTRWCRENKGTIMGAVLAANGIGGALAIQIITPILTSSSGYRGACFTVGCILVAVLVIIAIFFKDAPTREPLATEGEIKPEENKKKARGEWVGIEFKEALKKPYFYLALVAIFFTGFILQGLSGVVAPHYSDIGFDDGKVALLLSTASIALTLSKFLTGFVYDRIGLRLTTGLCMLLATVYTVLLTVISPDAFGTGLALVNCFFGAFALPLETVMLPIYASELFGAKSFNQTLGIFVSVNTAGYALGAPVINLFYQFIGNYNAAFLLCGAVMLLVIVIMQIVITLAHKERDRVEENTVSEE